MAWLQLDLVMEVVSIVVEFFGRRRVVELFNVDTVPVRVPIAPKYVSSMLT